MPLASDSPHIAASPAGPLRVFFALWPEAATRRALWRTGLRLPAGGRSIAESDLHVTLLFLGRIGESQRQAMVEQAARLRAPRFRLRFDQIASWQHGRIVCLTAPSVPALQQLHRQLRDLARALALRVEARALHPHVTLRRDLPASLARRIGGSVTPVYLRATRFCLVASDPAARGARYRMLASWPLG